MLSSRRREGCNRHSNSYAYTNSYTDGTADGDTYSHTYGYRYRNFNSAAYSDAEAQPNTAYATNATPAPNSVVVDLVRRD